MSYSVLFQDMLKNDLKVSKHTSLDQKYSKKENLLIKHLYYDYRGIIPNQHLAILWTFIFSFIGLIISTYVVLFTESIYFRLVMLLCIILVSLSVFYCVKINQNNKDLK